MVALEAGALVGLSACGVCPGGSSPERNGRHSGSSRPPRGRVGRGRVPLAGPTRCWPTSHSEPPRSHSAGRALPLGPSRAPTWEPRQVPLGARVGLSKRASKSEWEHQGRGSLAPLGPSPLARRHIAGSHSPARGAPRVPPLGGRATTVRAPLPLGYLPRRSDK